MRIKGCGGSDSEMATIPIGETLHNLHRSQELERTPYASHSNP